MKQTIDVLDALSTPGESLPDAQLPRVLKAARTFPPRWSARLVRWYGSESTWRRSLIRRIVLRREGGPMFSRTLREIFRRCHGVDVGLYSHGGCFEPGRFDPGVTVGRYSSIAVTARVLTTEWPLDHVSTHGLFLDPAAGLVDRDYRQRVETTVGHDVWIGHNAIVLPSARTIGTGAIIGANAVVRDPVPPYAVVVGNPARVVRHRFGPDTRQRLLATEWWERSLAELLPILECLEQPVEGK